jgi:hypothetical protein
LASLVDQFLRLQEEPPRSAQHYDGNSSAGKILLVPDVFVSGKKNLELSPLRFGQEVAVG